MQKVTLCTEIVEKNPFQSTHSLIHMKIFTSITVLAIARTLQEERQLMQRLQHNGEQMMHAIATRLLEPSDADAS